MKKYNKIVIVLASLLTLIGCKDKMIELNTNSDLISDTRVQYMFTGAIQNWFSMGGETDNGGMHAVMQYLVHYTNATNIDLIYYRNPTQDDDLETVFSTEYYNLLFGGEGNRLQSILTYIDTQVDEDDQPKYADIYAICEGLLAYEQFRVLESYGATVYGDAFKAISEGITDPHYEYMQDVFADIDATLKKSVNQLNSTMTENCQTLGSQDYFTGWKSEMATGNRGCVISSINNWSQQRAQWKKFFNMLRLENAWKVKGRLSEIGLNFETIFNEVAAVKDGYFESVDGALWFHSTIGTGSSDANIVMSAHFCVSENFMNLLEKNKDPRIPLLARPSGATEKTSLTFAMMKEYFPDTLAKYYYLDGKHPYLGLQANPARKSQSFNENGFVSTGVQYFTLPNPKGTEAFRFAYPWSPETTPYEFCQSGLDHFNCSILVGCECAYRYFIVCAGKNYANHDYGGNGIKGLGAAYKSELQADGLSTSEGGATGDLHLRRAEFSYPRQCYLLSMIGKTFGGKTAAQWYEEGVRGSFEMLQGQAHRLAVQAYTGGDAGHEYPSSLTQKFPDGTEVTYNFPYSYSDAEVEEYIAAHPYSKENLLDQFYIHAYIEPHLAWNYWRKTGLPEFKEHETRESADAEEHIYLETPYSGTQKLVMNRRNCLPDRNTINKNYAEAKEFLQNDPSNPKFGQWLETDGEIWWESANGYPTGYSWE